MPIIPDVRASSPPLSAGTGVVQMLLGVMATLLSGDGMKTEHMVDMSDHVNLVIGSLEVDARAPPRFPSSIDE